MVKHGRITKRGSRMMRWILSEAVRTHVRCAPKSNVTRFYKRLARKKGTGKATVATASKMLRVIYWMLKISLKAITVRFATASCALEIKLRLITAA
ncbi:MAG: hypothetical protein K8823_1186 [Cenarchaeum symbiont of Oopsacas minuta]|nr:hypothetical protein [Cenarchaeum symbiont of Oopsacas minuta]MDI1495878.1 hypothetical protein [Cenarchaeum symbiont of Oopsacas minuta]